MDLIDLIVTVCALAAPANCEERHLEFQWSGSLQQCANAAPPYIAQWIGEHRNGARCAGAASIRIRKTRRDKTRQNKTRRDVSVAHD